MLSLPIIHSSAYCRDKRIIELYADSANCWKGKTSTQGPGPQEERHFHRSCFHNLSLLHQKAEKHVMSQWVSLGTFLFQVCALGSQQRSEIGDKMEKERKSVSSQTVHLPTVSFNTLQVQKDIPEENVQRGRIDNHREHGLHQASACPVPGQ